jgi:hypothetical protein
MDIIFLSNVNTMASKKDQKQKEREEEKAQVAKKVLEVVEFIDDMLPIVGKVMDLEIVDEIEERIVEEIVSAVLDGVENTEDPFPWSA